MGDKAPFTRSVTVTVAAVGTAGNDLTAPAAVAPFAGTVTSVTYIPATAVTGANTNSRTLSVVNKGQAGSGTTTVASLALTSGVNAAAYDEKAATLSATAADLVVAAGDVLAWLSTHIGTGITDPGGQIRIEFSRS